jgi:uncharacterized protein YcbX
MLIGTLDAVRRYPVKSLAGEILERGEIGVAGIPGDRGRALFARGEHARAGKTFRGKECDHLHLIADAATARDEVMRSGVDVELVDGDHFFDVAPISLIVDRWLDSLDERVGYAVEWERFRPNLFVRADPGFGALEGDVVGWDLQLGTTRLRVRAPIRRCVVVTYHPHDTSSDPRILSFLAAERDATMGVYCDVVIPGGVCVGDRLVKEAP